MRWKRPLMIIGLLILVSTITVVADSAYEWLRGKKVETAVNSMNIAESAYLVESSGKTYLPVRDVAEQLGVIVDWDKENNKLNLYKPNVHMAFNVKRKDGSYGTFGKVDYNKELSFLIFTQIDNLKVKVHSLKYEVAAPDGTVLYSYEDPSENQDQALMWGYSPDINLIFDQLGEYKVKIYMNLEEDGEYFLVSEKILYSISE